MDSKKELTELERARLLVRDAYRERQGGEHTPHIERAIMAGVEDHTFPMDVARHAIRALLTKEQS